MCHKSQTKLYYVKKDMSFLGHQTKEKYSLPLMKKITFDKKDIYFNRKYYVFSEDPNKFRRPCDEKI